MLLTEGERNDLVANHCTSLNKYTLSLFRRIFHSVCYFFSPARPDGTMDRNIILPESVGWILFSRQLNSCLWHSDGGLENRHTHMHIEVWYCTWTTEWFFINISDYDNHFWPSRPDLGSTISPWLGGCPHTSALIIKKPTKSHMESASSGSMFQLEWI